MALSKSLSAWASILQRKKPLTIKQRIFGIVTASKVSRFIVVVTVLTLTLGASQVRTVSEASTTLMFATGFYACMAAQFVFHARGTRLRELVSDTASIAKTLEIESSDASQACLARAKRADSLLASQYMVMGSFLVLSISVTVMGTGRYYGCAWPKLHGAWGDWTLCFLQFAAAMLGTTSYYFICALLGSISIWIGGMYRALAVQFREARSKEEILRLIRHHENLDRHARATEFFLADVLIHLFVCCFTCPLSSTMDVLIGEVSVVTFSSGPLLMSVFLPFSAISQELMDASTSIGSAAFEAVFASDRREPQEELFVRRALLLTIASSRRPAQLSCRGLGPLSLGAAGNALRTWYSLVNMVVGSSRNIRGP